MWPSIFGRRRRWRLISTPASKSDGDSAFIAKAIGDIARAQGTSKVARAAGLSHGSLYRALSGEPSPDFATILKVTRALGVRLHASAA